MITMNKKTSLLFFLVVVLNCFAINAQPPIWDFESRSVKKVVSVSSDTPQTFRSQIPNSTKSIHNLPHIDYASLFDTKTDLTGGIQARIGQSHGSAKLSVYSYNSSKTNGKGDLLYRAVTHSTNLTGFNGIEESPGDFNIKKKSQTANLNFLDYGTSHSDCANFATNWMTTYFRSLGGGSGGDWQKCAPYFDAKQPIVIELTLFGNIEVFKIKIPGVGELDVIDAFYDQYANRINIIPTHVNLASSSTNLHILNSGIKNISNERVLVKNASVYLERVIDQQTSNSKQVTFPAHIDSSKSYTFMITVLTSSEYSALATGVYNVILRFEASTNANDFSEVIHIPLTFFRKKAANQPTVYDITKTDYSGLPVFKLRGGLSAEYTVQKSIAALSSGISHTWEVRSESGNMPTLLGGGPETVFSSPNFLRKSIQKTVDLYNMHLGDKTPFDTVIISTGFPSVPYISYMMGAPILPFHFLVSANSLNEIESMVNVAIKDGYSCYSTAGYDPSIEGEGVAWLKLLDLPAEYKKFLEDHQVKNVILMGASETGYGEVLAQRIKFKFKENASATYKPYEPGSVYVMKHGKEEGLNLLRSYYSDYDSYPKEKERVIADWESGIVEDQITNFRNSILKISDPPNVYAIKGAETMGLYNISIDFALKFRDKNKTKLGTNSFSSLVMNEYLIGFPLYEIRKGQLPFLYWQDTSPKNAAERIKNLVRHKLTSQYPAITSNFNNIPVKFNSKANRQPFIDALRGFAGMTNVVQNTWQKPDVWNPSNGMNAPCEIAARDIINNLGGATSYKNWQESLTKLTIDDLKSMTVKDDENLGPAPNPTVTVNVASIPDAGLEIKRYEFPASEYWNSRELLREVGFFNITTPSNELGLGWLDGFSKTGNNRKQRITISQFDLENTKDEYELKVGYKFAPEPEDGFKSYNNELGDQQKMDCFEYTKVPKTNWLDIPSRVMARAGAVWIVNGSVYDWDYNGIPGVVPFIKQDGIIKAQPQILSYKGEAAFAWNWGTNKQVKLIGRPKEIPANTLVNDLGTLFHTETSNYSNVLGGMTFMDDGKLYDIKSLQPQWMLNYKEFNSRYLGPSGTPVRCFLSNPNPNTCQQILENAWGTISLETAPEEEGWNNCDRLYNSEDVQRFSTLAYRQYDQLFEQVPNARTYVAIKGKKLDIGIIDGDLGNFSDGRGVNYSKTFGMKNSEVSRFYKYKGYDKMLNLDGGSSSQIWYNGRGPLHDWTGYPLVEDNQGPYYSRLVSSYLMLVPKKHTELIGPYQQVDDNHITLDNSNISFNYDDDLDHGADKSFVSLSPSLDLFTKPTDGDHGIIAGNFKIINKSQAEGAILFYLGEDTYYEDTEGQRVVNPELRNLMVVGVGKIPNPMLDILKSKLVLNNNFNQAFHSILNKNDHAFYYIKMVNSKIIQYSFDTSPYNKYFQSENWHSFLLARYQAVSGSTEHMLRIDNAHPSGENFSHYSSSRTIYNMFTTPSATHATIGAVNIDGRFVTGNAELAVDNYLFVIGRSATSRFTANDIKSIAHSLASTNRRLPENLKDKFYNANTYALQFEEQSGRHRFSLSPVSNVLRLYGLDLNVRNVQNISTYSGQTPVDLITKPSEKPNLGREILVYPNPTQNDLSIYLYQENQIGDVIIRLFDVAGRRIKSFEKKYNLKKGSHEIILNNIKKAGVTTGLYTLSIINGEHTTTKKILVN